MYSQNKEEKIIINHFDKFIGKFLDIGAFNGKTFSNTYRLVELGWSGVCIEPSPTVFKDLIKLHDGNGKIKCSPKAIGDKKGTAMFFDSGGDAISTFSTEHKNKWEKNTGKKIFKNVTVEVITAKDMFDEFGYDFDFINLDVESTNWKIFAQFPLGKLKNLKLICVEHDREIEKIRKFTGQFGFKEIHLNGENIIVGR